MSDPALVAAINRLAAAIERMSMIAGVEPEPEPCVRCAGRGSWGPGATCPACGGSGRGGG